MTKQHRYEFVTDDIDDPRIDEVRQRVRELNAAQKEMEERFPHRYRRYSGPYRTKTRYYVWLRGRGNRTSPEKIQAWKDAFKQKYGRDYKWSDQGVKYRLAQDLPVWMAERVAVYIMSRTEHIYDKKIA